MTRHAVVTGASSGIGAATVRRLAADGLRLSIGARRYDRLLELADATGAEPHALDVTERRSVAAFCDAVPECSLLVLCAGGAIGLDPVASAHERDWQWMWETNVMGSLRMVQQLLPKLLDSGDGQIIFMGSIAGTQPYPGGGGYNAAKSAVHALREVLRLELVGRPVRVTEIAPGMVQTDFSEVRFRGDAERAAAVYEGVTPLTADDIAECVSWVAARPSHVNVEHLVVQPRDQADARTIARRPADPT